ncbi:hypothetical protein [Streptomyces avicenniae]|uniref:hypothetical protein n=1 Tax=Streptomyces avicenniae TaxID=500153 RepID=UPI000699D054|nr:hypothetical protein [Streptomyces avicenniae]
MLWFHVLAAFRGTCALSELRWRALVTNGGDPTASGPARPGNKVVAPMAGTTPLPAEAERAFRLPTEPGS